jgi:hypothetical protein
MVLLILTTLYYTEQIEVVVFSLVYQGTKD